MASSLFEKYGGFRNVSAIVMDFYERALESDQIGDYFDAVDMTRLIDHQTKFIASLMGGPASFSDDRLSAVHAHLGLDHADFDEMARILAETLGDHGVAAADVASVIDAIEARRGAVLGRASR
jgi:hemoglobin